MKRTLFRALGLVELFSFLLFFTPSALAATVSAKWVVLADQHQVQPQVMLKFTLSAPATVTILYQIDPFCGCGIAGWNYFSVEHRPKGSPGDTGWDSDPSHYGPYRAFVSDTTKDLTPSSGDGQLDKSQEVMVGSDGSQAFEYRIVGHPKIVVHANSTPAVTLTVQVSTSTNVLTGSAVGPATGGATVATTPTTTSTSGVEDCVNNRMWTVTANGAPAGTYYFKSDGTVQGIDNSGRQVWAGTWKALGHYRYSFQFAYMGQMNIQYIAFVDSSGSGHADVLNGYSDAAMRNLNRQGKLVQRR